MNKISPLPLELFNYHLSSDLIASKPSSPRDSSRLLYFDRMKKNIEHKYFYNILDYLNKDDLLIINRTKVIPARLHVKRLTGGVVELLFCYPVNETHEKACVWKCIGRPRKSLKMGNEFLALDGTRLFVSKEYDDMVYIMSDKPLWNLIQNFGEIPLPPYIEKLSDLSQEDHKKHYQSVFANVSGAVAAPTASLHFTDTLISSLKKKGVRFADILLHVGPGTFLPVRNEHAEDISKHRMHSEWYYIPPKTCDLIKKTKMDLKSRVIAVGTTSVRAVESWFISSSIEGLSDLFIYPGFKFSVVDAIITNFHLPKSTLLMLISAFSDRESIMSIYEQAISKKYRFFSYGDAMLIV